MPNSYLYFDLDKRSFVHNPQTKLPVTEIFALLAQSAPFRVVFWQAGAAIDPGDGIGLRLCAKLKGQYDGVNILNESAYAYTAAAAPEPAFYELAPSFDIGELKEALGVDWPTHTVENDKPSVALGLEGIYTNGAQTVISRAVTLTVENNYYKGAGGDDPGVDLSSARWFRAAIPSGQSYAAVVFATNATPPADFANANWHFLGSPMVTNPVDGDPLNLFPGTLTARSAAGFTLQLSGDTDSANYVLEGCAVMD